MKHVQTLSQKQGTSKTNDNDHHGMRNTTTIEWEKRKEKLPCHGKDRVEHIDRQGITPYIKNPLERLAITESSEE